LIAIKDGFRDCIFQYLEQRRSYGDEKAFLEKKVKDLEDQRVDEDKIVKYRK
jgi:hypothetical protein